MTKKVLALLLSLLIVLPFFVKATVSQASKQEDLSLLFAPQDWQSTTQSWPEVVNQRENITLKVKRPPSWDKPFDHCEVPIETTGLTIPANCVKTVIFTEDFPSDDPNSMGRDLSLISQTELEIEGLQAVRKVYAITSNLQKTPDTYQLWIYKDDKPLAFVVSWIGHGTADQKARQLIQTLDTMMKTLDLYVNE